MTFANTGLLALSALFAVPLVIHLLNRRRYRRVPWAAMDFLLRAYKQNRRRLRLENLLLLLLRCALPVLLALAVARPRFETAPLGMGNQGRHHVLVLDRSYSMAYRDISGVRPFDRLKQNAGLLLDLVAKRQNEKVSLVLFGGPVGTPVKADLDVARAQKVLSAMDDPGDGRAELLPALQAAAQLAQAETEKARIYVFSDFQVLTVEGKPAEAAAPAGAATPPAAAPAAVADPLRALRDLCGDLAESGHEVFLFPLTPAGRVTNTQVVGLTLDPENVVVRVPAEARGELVHHGPDPIDARVTLFVDGKDPQPRTVHLRPGERTEVSFRLRFLDEGMHALELKLDEDGLPVDDVRRAVTRVRDRIRVLLVEGRETAQGDEFLTHAYLWRYVLDPTQGDATDEELTLFQTSVVDEDRLQADPTFLQRQDLVVLLNASGPREDVAQRLGEFVAAGGGLLLVPGPNTSPDLWNAHLFGVGGELGPLPLRLLEIGGHKGSLASDQGTSLPAQFARPKLVDDKHLVAADFAQSELRDLLEAMPVYRYWTTSRADAPKETRVLLELAGATDAVPPALLASRPFGRGEAMLLTSSICMRPDRWNRLDAADSIRFPLLHSIGHWLARDPKADLNRLVGESITHWLADFPAALYMTKPGDAGRVALRVPSTAGRTAKTTGWTTPPFEDTAQAGIYRLQVEFEDKTKAASEVLFAVNPDPEEGILDYVGAARLTKELPAAEVRHEVEVEVGSTVEAGASEMGKTFLWLALLVGLGESVLAGLLGARRR